MLYITNMNVWMYVNVINFAEKANTDRRNDRVCEFLINNDVSHIYSFVCVYTITSRVMTVSHAANIVGYTIITSYLHNSKL